MMSEMKMFNLGQATLAKWLEDANSTDRNVRKIFVVASGYEARASYWAKKVFEDVQHFEKCIWKVVGFTDSSNAGSRPKNDDFYSRNNLEIKSFASTGTEPVCAEIEDLVLYVVKQSGKSRIQVHLDYTSMPRRWYCALFTRILKVLRAEDKLFMWYCGGEYDGELYPTAGVSDVSLFSGLPSTLPKVRTHVFGLGFDRIRASAIHRVLDPQNMVCFYGGLEKSYLERVEKDNRDIIAAARMVFSVPVDDFPNAFAKLADVTREFSYGGDVILVPDGPKPLVLASSLVPLFLDKRGIVSLHVRRRNSEEAGRVDVQPSGLVVGFSVAGEGEVTQVS